PDQLRHVQRHGGRGRRRGHPGRVVVVAGHEDHRAVRTVVPDGDDLAAFSVARLLDRQRTAVLRTGYLAARRALHGAHGLRRGGLLTGRLDLHGERGPRPGEGEPHHGVQVFLAVPQRSGGLTL